MRKSRLLAFLTALFSLVLSGCDFFRFGPSISLEQTSVTLNLANEYERTYQIVPSIDGDDKQYTFSYSTLNRSVATCTNNGLVTAKSVGQAKISILVPENPRIKEAFLTINVINETTPSVHIEKNRYSIGKGKTKQIDVVVLNSESSLVWESSNTDVATVDNGLVTVKADALDNATSIITASLQDNPEIKASCTVCVIEYDFDYTVMFYMSGSTLEFDEADRTAVDGEIGLISGDICEILSIQNIPDTFKIIIETGGAGKWFINSANLDGANSISYTKLQRWEVVKTSPYSAFNSYEEKYMTYYNKLKLIETLTTNRMADQNSFESFLNWGLEDYNAAQMGVIISGHGGGIAGCAYDDNYSDNSLNTAEIYLATKGALESNNRDKFTWIGFDCCLMGCADVASMMSDYYDYMVGSQETEPGEGWDHDVWMKKIINNVEVDPKTVINSITSSFVNSSHQYCGYTYQGQKYICYATLAGYDLSKMNTLVSEFNSLVDDFGTTTSCYRKYLNAFKAKTTFNAFGEASYGLADMASFLDTLSTKEPGYETAISKVKTAINNLVFTNHYCEEYDVDLCGINVFMHYSIDPMYQVPCYKADYNTQYHTKFSGWQQMCLTNWYED